MPMKRIRKLVPCLECTGTGKVRYWLFWTKDCKECNGTGEVGVIVEEYEEPYRRPNTPQLRRPVVDPVNPSRTRARNDNSSDLFVVPIPYHTPRDQEPESFKGGGGSFGGAGSSDSWSESRSSQDHDTGPSSHEPASSSDSSSSSSDSGSSSGSDGGGSSGGSSD
jgi:hypothetical protein